MIKLDKDWYITADPNQYILLKRTLVKSKTAGMTKEVMVTKGYFSSLSHAYRRYEELALRAIVADPNEQALAEVLQEFKKVSEIVRNAVEDATKAQ